MKKQRFQIIKTQITSTSAHNISVELDRSYSKVAEIYCFADPIYANNTNLNFSSDLKINNVMQFSTDFPSALLFPIKDNDTFTKSIEADANGSILEVSVTDSAYTTNYYFYIIVKLINE